MSTSYLLTYQWQCLCNGDPKVVPVIQPLLLLAALSSYPYPYPLISNPLGPLGNHHPMSSENIRRIGLRFDAAIVSLTFGMLSTASCLPAEQSLVTPERGADPDGDHEPRPTRTW